MRIISRDIHERQFRPRSMKSHNAVIPCMTGTSNILFNVFTNHHKESVNISLKQMYYPTYPVKTTHKHAIIVNIPFTKTFCHNIIDLLPLLIQLDQNQEYDLVVVPGGETTKKFIQQFKLKFSSVIFVDHAINISAKKISWLQYHIKSRNQRDVLKLKKQFSEQLNLKTCCNKMIYCTRNTGGGALHGRQMEESNEQEIITLSKQFAEKNDLEFVLFGGCDNNGEQMSLLDQARLFNQAKIVTGPHGGALANIIYIPQENKCKVCEFTSGIHTAIQRNISNFGKNYNNLLAQAPETYLDYFLIPFTKKSNKKYTSIGIENYKTFLSMCI